ncbi:MAG: HDOD domain-containing protein [Aquificae bacterium]|nr:HDOD domain-containing protein [Aquificota bacterium]
MYVLFKQPVFDREGNVVFYEVTLRDLKTKTFPKDLDPLKATSITINIITEVGPERVGNGKPVFINVPSLFLEATMFELLPPEFIGIELVDNRSITNELLKAVNELVDRGFTFCIDDFGFEKVNYLPLLSKCHMVKINWKELVYSEEELREVMGILKELRKGVIAKYIETEEDYDNAKRAGADYFQGFYLARPLPIRDVRSLFFMKGTVIKLYEALKNRDLKKAADVIEQDVGATYRLLRFVKSLYRERAQDINSVEDAISFLSLNNVANFTLALAITELFAEHEEEEYIKRSLLRASLAEELAKLYAPEMKEKAYLTGLFSLTDELMGEHPQDIAKELELDEEIVEAYETRHNELGLILSLVELLEEDPENREVIGKISSILKVPEDKIRQAVQNAKRIIKEITYPGKGRNKKLTQ